MADFQHSSQQFSINVMVGIWHLAEENLDWNDDGYALAWQHTLQQKNCFFLQYSKCMINSLQLS